MCERGVVGQSAKLLIGAECTGVLLRQHPHGRGKGGSQKFRSMKWNMGEANEECEARAEERSNTQAHDTWMRWRAQTPWANVTCDTVMSAEKCEKMWHVRVFCSHPSRMQQIAISCERSCYNNFFFFLKKKELHQFWSHCHHEELEEEEEDATFGIDEKGLVQVALLQILNGDGSLLWLLFGSLIGVSSVHSCPIRSVRYTSFPDISHVPQRMGSRSGLPVPIYPLRCTSTQSSQFWVAKHDILGLVGNDREFLQVSFWDISSVHCGPQNALSVRRFRRAEHRGVSPS